MAYIEQADFLAQIQDVNLQQILNNNDSIRVTAVNTATAEARSYLIQKYDIDKELLKTGAARDPQMVMTIIDLALFHLHSRIAPRNIPELRQGRYDNAIQWLKMCAYGDITPALEKLNPISGMRTRFGGNKKNENSY